MDRQAEELARVLREPVNNVKCGYSPEENTEESDERRESQ